MSTEGRNYLKDWLSQIKVSGRVLDVGGISCPMRNKVIDKGITDYKILDIKEERKGVRTNYIVDLNNSFNNQIPYDLYYSADFVFCTEVMQFLYNPLMALQNIYRLLADNGTLYITFHLTHPPMKGTDYLRYTRDGVIKLLNEANFEIEDIQEPMNGYYLIKAVCQH